VGRGHEAAIFSQRRLWMLIDISVLPQNFPKMGIILPKVLYCWKHRRRNRRGQGGHVPLNILVGGDKIADVPSNIIGVIIFVIIFVHRPNS